ncbi:filamentous hemagglutinin family protein [Paraburkholderia sp. GAS448]|uniref:hemagglutinin repeat-containing protein n=1 Tax=Paraburkholderia sp. GAS448 TaxID=3035136 RepID=UPI003D1A60C7
MNKNHFRLVYSRLRNMLVAVEETASATGKSSGETTVAGHAPIDARPMVQFAFRPIAFAALVLAGALPAFMPASYAQIVAAPGSDASVIQTQNGLPQVNIARPSGAGVSVNTYSQFDVQKPGAILNNSPVITGTQLAGQINGNPNFAAGQYAKIIVNQVNSSAASQINGPLEVAGTRAQVVIANGSGISVNGGAFINTSRATLTTGTPSYGPDGSLSGFDVRGGQITVQGDGLNASNVDQVDLIARSVAANAKLYANTLNVVTGANHVDHDSLAATPIVGDGPAPATSIDVSQLGGMYANRIILASNEYGVGVSNAGVIAAQAGDLTLQSNGQLVLSGRTTASGNLAATGSDIQNSGTTYAQQNANLSASGTFTNSGTLAAQQNTTVNAGSVNSTGTLGAGVNGDDGSVGHSGDLSVTASGQLNATGQNVAGGNASLSGSGVNLAGSQSAANGNLSLTTNAGDLNLSNATTSAGGAVNARAAGALINDHGTVTAQTDLHVSGQSVDNSDGTLQAGQNATIDAGAGFTNARGAVLASQAATVAALTSNVIIMETRVVDGQSVLVPVVYLAQASQQNMNGPLIAATDINLQNTQTFTNSGTVQASNSLTIDGKSIDNAFGALKSGGLMSLTTTGDVDLTSAKVNAGSLALNAGGNLILDTATKTLNQVSDTGATRTTTTLGPLAQINVAGDAAIVTGGNFEQNAGALSVGGNLGMQIGGDWTLGAQQTSEHKVVERANGVSDTNLNSTVGSSVQVGGVSAIGVGGDLTARGAQIDLGGGGTVAVNGNVLLGTASATSTVDSNSAGSDAHGSYAESLHQSDQTLTGTTLHGGDTLTIASGKDITLSGSTISLDKGNANLLAVGDVNVVAATETHTLNSQETHSHSGVASSSTVTSGIDQAATLSQGSLISADGVTIAGGRDINVAGSTIVGTNDVALSAARNVTITTSQDTVNTSTYYEKQESGFGSTGSGISYGSKDQKDTTHDSSVTQNGSLIGSLNGNLTVSAGNDLHVTGSDLIAAQNITGTGANVIIDAAANTTHHDETHEVSKSGFTLGVAGSVVDAVQGAVDQAHAAGKSEDSRAAALHTIAAVGDAAAAAEGLADGKTPDVKVELSFGSSHSTSSFSEDGTTQTGSTVKAGGTAMFAATGNGTAGSGNITIAGSDVSANDVVLAAKNQVNLVNTTDTDSTRSANESSSSSVGISYGTQGWGVDAAMSKANGDSNSDAAMQNNTHVSGTNSVTIVSGGDTNIIGANVNGNQVTANVGGNLNIASVQDTTTSAAHQESSGGGFSISQGGASANFSSQHGDASGSYAGINEQAGIQAGAGGFDITVKGNTDLKGAVIASDADASKNTLTTATLTFSDIQNQSDYSAKSSGFSAGGSIGAPTKGTGVSSVGNAGGYTPMLSQSESGSDSATTKSGISAGTINITDAANQTQDVASLNRDTSDTNGTVAKTPDVNALLDKQADMMNASSAAGAAVATQIGALADAKHDAAQKAADDATKAGDTAAAAAYQADADSWAEGGVNRVALHTAGGALIAGLGGGSALGGAAGAAVASTLAGKLNSLADGLSNGNGSGADPGLTLGNVAGNLLAGGFGGLVGGNSGAFTAANADLYNRSNCNAEGKCSTGSQVLDAVMNVVNDPWGSLNHALNSIIPAPGQNPPADPNPLVQANDNGKPPATGGAVVTPPTMVCTPNAGCAMTPAIATPGTPGYVPSNATLNDGNNAPNDSSRPVGVSGSPMDVPRGTNQPTTIGGVDYSGHAIDQMQGRGVPPSAVKNTIENGVIYPTREGTTGYYDPTNNIRVVTNSKTGLVVTVIPGAPGK